MRLANEDIVNRHRYLNMYSNQWKKIGTGEEAEDTNHETYFLYLFS